MILAEKGAETAGKTKQLHMSSVRLRADVTPVSALLPARSKGPPDFPTPTLIASSISSPHLPLLTPSATSKHGPLRPRRSKLQGVFDLPNLGPHARAHLRFISSLLDVTVGLRGPCQPSPRYGSHRVRSTGSDSSSGEDQDVSSSIHRSHSSLRGAVISSEGGRRPSYITHVRHVETDYS